MQISEGVDEEFYYEIYCQDRRQLDLSLTLPIKTPFDLFCFLFIVFCKRMFMIFMSSNRRIAKVQ